MKFFNKDIDSMTEEELQYASESLKAMMDSTNDRRSQAIRNNPKFKKRIKDFPHLNINPAFMDLKELVEAELIKRKENQNV